ncbi:hypothetical protein RIF29_39280 [Crotalaria pallida]|uniref:Uncharacterized protein n=1 Tax=Crotalaria pallida TaxID=3830 RepID=A0AAN9HT51_CROPI
MATYTAQDIADIREFLAFLLFCMAHCNALMKKQFSENYINPETQLISSPVQLNFSRALQAPPAPLGLVSGPIPPLSLAPELVPAALAPAPAPAPTVEPAPTQASESIPTVASASQPQELKVSLSDRSMPYIDLLDKPIYNDELAYGDNISENSDEALLVEVAMKIIMVLVTTMMACGGGDDDDDNR